MKEFFTPNLERNGRILRGVWAAVLLVGGTVAAFYLWWVGVALLALGLFALFEASRGWCVMRACGIKTKL